MAEANFEVLLDGDLVDDYISYDRAYQRAKELVDNGAAKEDVKIMLSVCDFWEYDIDKFKKEYNL